MQPGQANFETSEQRHYRPRALLFSMLSGLWVFPSLGAFWILFHDADWKTGGLEAVRVEQWVAVAILAAHVHFVTLALFLRRTEKLVPAPGPDDDDEDGFDDARGADAKVPELGAERPGE